MEMMKLAAAKAAKNENPLRKVRLESFAAGDGFFPVAINPGNVTEIRIGGVQFLYQNGKIS